jgi:adenylate cyclase
MPGESTAGHLQQQLAESEAEVDRLTRRVQEEVWLLNRLIQISNQLGAKRHLAELLELMMHSAKEMFQVEACSVILVDEETGELVFDVAVGDKRDEVIRQRIPVGQGIAGRVVQTGEPLRIRSAQDDPYFYSGIDQAVGFKTRNLLAVPLQVRGRTIGVVEIINTQNGAEFTSEDVTLASALASQAAVAIDNARLNEGLQRQLKMFDRLIHVSTQLGTTLQLSELLKLIMDSAKEMFQVEACSVILVDEETGELIFEVAVGARSDEVAQQRIPPGQGIAGRVVQTGKPLLVRSASDDPHFFGGVDQAVGFQTRNLMAVPLQVRGRTIGVVEIINTHNRAEFTAEDLNLAVALACQAAIAIDNARLYQELSDALVTARVSYRL